MFQRGVCACAQTTYENVRGAYENGAVNPFDNGLLMNWAGTEAGHGHPHRAHTRLFWIGFRVPRLHLILGSRTRFSPHPISRRTEVFFPSCLRTRSSTPPKHADEEATMLPGQSVELTACAECQLENGTEVSVS